MDICTECEELRYQLAEFRRAMTAAAASLLSAADYDFKAESK